MEQCTDLSKEIASYSKEVRSNVDNGIQNMSNLHESAVQTQQNSSTVSSQMKVLMAQTEEAIDIINIIHEIAEQTNLLALNASIEAARAGEAGRGFAVVACEITDLANQTQRSTQSIEQLISKLKKEASDASNAVKEMTSISDTQNTIIFNTERNFNQIKESVDKMSNNIVIQGTQMEDILSATIQMLDNITTISSISEEITAGTAVAIETTDKNKEIADNVTRLIQNLTAHMQELAAMQMK